MYSCLSAVKGLEKAMRRRVNVDRAEADVDLEWTDAGPRGATAFRAPREVARDGGSILCSQDLVRIDLDEGDREERSVMAMVDL